MARHHQVEWGVGRLVWVVHVHVVAADSQLVRGVTSTGFLFLEHFASEVNLFSFSLEVVVLCRAEPDDIVANEWIACGATMVGKGSGCVKPTTNGAAAHAVLVLVGLRGVEVEIVLVITVCMLHLFSLSGALNITLIIQI